jgi:hypothetical protein
MRQSAGNRVVSDPGLGRGAHDDSTGGRLSGPRGRWSEANPGPLTWAGSGRAPRALVCR